MAVKKIERNAGNLMMLSTINRTSGRRQNGEMLNACPSDALAASTSAVEAFASEVRLIMRKMTEAIKIEGPTVHIIVRMCLPVVCPPTKLGTRIVVSESGDTLSPKYPP